jgi:DNA-binding transcriptional LysR family regulator
MDSIYLKTLVEVVRAGSLTKAADLLCVTQSAVSRRIKFLEEQYGSMLLDRSGPVIVPTPTGSMVLEKAREIVEIERELMSSLGVRERERGLTFLCTPTFGTVYLPGILREYMLKHIDGGNLRFLFEVPEKIVKALREGICEIAVIEHCSCFDLPDFETVALPGDEMVFAVAPSLGMRGETVSIEEVFAHTLYGRSEGCCSRTLLEANLKGMGRTIGEFRRVVVFDDLNLILRSVRGGDGVAFISSDLIESDIRAGNLMAFRVPGFNHRRSRTFVSSDQLSAGSPAGRFAAVVLDRFQGVSSKSPSYCGTSCVEPVASTP